MEHAIVMVLGDVGHSPRTCFHALSLANKGIPVQLMGYYDSIPHKKILDNDKIEFVALIEWFYL